MKRAACLTLVTLLVLVPFGQALAWTDDDDARGPGPLADGTPWSDDLDDANNVYVPTGGLVGVEVAGGEVHLLPGHDEGWVASREIPCPDGYRYDLVLLDAVTPGDSYLNISILDPTKAPNSDAFANGTVPGHVNMTGTDESIFGVDPVDFPSIRIQVTLVADGTDHPRLLGWSLYFIPRGEWRDDFLGTGKMQDRYGLNVTSGNLEVDLSSSSSATHDPYPPVIFTDSRGDIDVFYPNAQRDGYKDDDTIAQTSITDGLDCGDLDDDGYIDLVLARSGNTGSRILWGSSSGKWSTADKTDLTHTDDCNDAAIGDFDGDGWKDIVMSSVDGMVADGAYVWLNNGDGTFNKNPDIKLSGNTGTVDAGDLNNDDYDDIVLTHGTYMSGPCYYGGLNGPDTTKDLEFFTGMTMTGVSETLIVDADKDGYLDVLFAMVNNRQAPVFLGAATGIDITVDYKLDLKFLPAGVAVGDVNGDSFNEIVYITTDQAGGGGLIEIFKGSSTGWDKDSKHEIQAGGAMYQIEVVDVDTDGYDDLLVGYSQDFKVFYGGTTWPTAADVSKSGLGVPSDMTVAVDTGGSGASYKGTFTTDPILLPTGMKWDILHLEGNLPEDCSVAISVLDNTMTAITGYEQLTEWDVDLSDIDNPGAISIMVELSSTSNASTPVIDWLLVNWLDEMSWRDQFYGNLRAVSMLNLGTQGFQLSPTLRRTTLPDLLFACLRSDSGYDMRSRAFMDDGTLSYDTLTPIEVATKGAHAVAAMDINDDQLLDLVFASYGSTPTTYTGTSPLFLGSPTGWYSVPYHTFSTTGARDVAIVDLNSDGHADIVFAQERDQTGVDVESALYWGSSSGWNATPDVEFTTKAASAVEAVDLDGDDLLDLVFACYEDATVSTDSMVFYQESTGFCGTTPDHRLNTVGARGVAWGDIDGDGHTDLVFANSFDGTTFATNSFVYWGQAGKGFKAAPTELATSGAMDVEVVDVDNDMDLDVIIANNRNQSGGYVAEAGIWINDGTGRLTTTSMHSIITDGAYAVATVDLDGAGVKDLVFACRNNGTTFALPSGVYHSTAGSWSFEPNILLPTVGAVDVLPLRLSDTDRGGYLSEAISPDPDDDVGTFHTLRYDAITGPSDSGTVAILDAETGEWLAQTPLSAGSNEWDLRGLFSYREHDSVRVLVQVEGLEGTTAFTLDDLWLNWSKRVKLPPVVLDLDIESTTVLRSQTVRLWVNVTDEFDLPGDLTALIEHQREGETVWRTTMLGSLVYSEGLWWRDVTPDRFQALGNYSFRVNVTDLDKQHSGYVYFPRSLEVLPNLSEAPVLLSATASANTVSLEWRAPRDTGDLPLEGYRVLRGTSEDSLSPVTSLDAFADSYEDTGLTNGQVYYYAVMAFNELGDGPWSEVLNATPVDVPDIPLGLVVEAGDGIVTLTWESPALDGGLPVLGYRIWRGEGSTSLAVVSEVGTVTEFVDEGLINGMTYHYAVTAFNTMGDGPATSPAQATPMGLSKAPRDVLAEAGVSIITISWSYPLDTGGGELTGFVVYRGLTTGGLEAQGTVSGTTAQFIDDDLVPGTVYHYAVAAMTDAGEGDMSEPITVTALGPAGAPLDLVATAGDGKVTLTWSAPATDGGSPVTGYVVLRGGSPTGLVDLAELSDILTYIDSSAVNGETYHYAVLAINALGRGTPSEPVETMPFKPATEPGKVTDFTAEVKGLKAILVWMAPEDDGGSPVTGYVILRGDSADSMVEVAQVGLVTIFNDEGLERGNTYTYAIKAVNEVGQGEASSTQVIKVEKEDDGSGDFPIAILIALIAIIGAVVVAVYMMSRRKVEE